MAKDNDQTGKSNCPLGAVDGRLGEVHHAWHEAERHYFDPDQFRFYIQVAIQKLRSVTFVLKHNKASIPQFDDWYAPWAERLAADPLMRWMVDARNNIDKRGDLETRSFVRAEIIASYLDPKLAVEVPAHLFEGPEAIIKNLPGELLDDYAKAHGTLKLQRRWVEATLKDYELLDAVAKAYARISELVFYAHRQAGLDASAEILDHDGRRIDLSQIRWMPPCMLGHEKTKSILISLRDGARMRVARKAVKYKASKLRRAEARYGQIMRAVAQADYDNCRELAEAYFKVASDVFLKDGYHQSIILMFKDRKQIATSSLESENKQQTFILMREHADQAYRIGADAVLVLAETWSAPYDKDRPDALAQDHKDRTEHLTASLITRASEGVYISAPIIRAGKAVSLGDAEIDVACVMFSLMPFLKAWNVPPPVSWRSHLTPSAPPYAKAKKVWRPEYIHPANDKCLCGSGRRFSACCSSRIQDRKHSDAGGLMEAGNFAQALLAVRADLSHYFTLYKRDTEPFLDSPGIKAFLDMDLRAFFEIIERLMFCYLKVDKAREFHNVLGRLEGAVSDPRWRRKMKYFRVLTALGHAWDRKAGLVEIGKYGHFRNEDDPEFLQLFLDLKTDDLSFADRVYFADRIVMLSKKPTDQLHYQSYKAYQYQMIGDAVAATKELKRAIKEFRVRTKEKELTFYQRYRLAASLDLLGTVANDKRALTEAGQLFDRLSDDVGVGEQKSDMLRYSGECHKKLGDSAQALERFQRSYELKPNAIVRAFVADGYLRLDQVSMAVSEIAAVEADRLRREEKSDFAFILAAIALRAGQTDLLQKARAYLKGLHALEPYFQQTRDEMLVKVVEALVDATSKPQTTGGDVK